MMNYLSEKFIKIAEAANDGDITKYTPLAPLPTDVSKLGDTTSFTQFIERFFVFIIGLSALFAVIMIIIGGLQYMSTDAVTGKKEGIKKLQSAVGGFLLVISAWLILFTVNPELVNFSIDIPPPPQTQNDPDDNNDPIGTCRYNVGGCYTNENQQKLNPGRFCVTYTTPKGVERQDCSGRLVIDQALCKGKAEFWKNRRVDDDSVTGCYANHTTPPGKLCVSYNDPFTNKQVQNCTGTINGSEIINQDSKACKDRQNGWKAQGYTVGPCYADEYRPTNTA
jgi:hypothetical protein